MAITWKATTTDYAYLDRNPDPTVTPIVVHYTCTESDGSQSGTVMGAEQVSDMPTFAESQMVRVTESVMLNWLHGEMGAEWVAAVEQMALDQYNRITQPPTNTTPPA